MQRRENTIALGTNADVKTSLIRESKLKMNVKGKEEKKMRPYNE